MLINEEMRALGPVMTAPIKGLTEEKLLQVNLGQLEETITEKAPTLWSILHHASSTPQQLERLTYKTHAAVSSNLFVALTYILIRTTIAYRYDGRHLLVSSHSAPLPFAAV